MIRILLVDDDVEFRNSVQAGLEIEGYTVTIAGDGQTALKQLASKAGFDVIITDLKMAGMDGVGLIKSIRSVAKLSGLPIILMTGFTDLIEAQEAHAVGANEFLPKPFHRSDLNTLVKRLTGREPAEAEPPERFCRLGIEDFANGRKINFGIYMKVTADRFIKIAHKGADLSSDRIKAYKLKGLEFLYLRQRDFQQYVGFAVEPEFAVLTEPDSAKRFDLLKAGSEILTHRIQHDGLDDNLYLPAAAFVEACMDLLTEDRRVVDLLIRLQTHSDQVLTHSLGTSVYSVLIGQRVQWNLPTNRFKLAIGGLLHDVGQQEISQHILATAESQWSHEDRAAYRTHCQLGSDMLDSIASLPDDVRHIVKQHHENCRSDGFPGQIKKTSIHPMAKLISVADNFCYRVVHPQGMTPMAALQEMTANCSDVLDKDFLGALIGLFRNAGDAQVS